MKGGEQMVRYPALEGEIAKRGMKKGAIAKALGITERTLRKKLSGESPFTWDEACEIHYRFFPDVEIATLFESA